MKPTIKKRVTLVLEVESEDELNMTDEYIEKDLRTEINCASNYYKVVGFFTKTLKGGINAIN